MKRERDEDKVMGPLFPRLHVNDTNNGGLRAPPRNKMALYELFSIPSQRSSSDAGGALPRRPHQAGSLVSSAFSGQSRGLERSVSSPFCAPHPPAHMQEKVHPHSVGKINQNTMSTCQEKPSKDHGFQRMACSAANEQMRVNCSSLHPDDFCIMKGPFEKKSGEDDDFRVPTCAQPGNVLHSNKDHHSIGREGTHSHLHSPQKSGATAHSSQSQVQSSHGMHLGRHGSYSLMSQRCENLDEGKSKKTVGLHKNMEGSMSHPSMREKAADPLKIHRPSSNEEHPTFVQNENTLHGGSVKRSQESHGSFREAKCLSDAEFKEKQVISNERTESCSQISLDKSLLEPSVVKCDKIAGEMVGGAECADRTGSPDDTGNIDPLGNANKNQALEDADRNDDASETSMVDSIPGVDICPDDVVGLIGPKHFWKARRAIVNQQRVFAVQVFELHRLIKVQKLIAGSPNLLLDDPSYFHSSPKSPVKDPSPSFLPKCHLQIKQNDGSHKVNESECATENTQSVNLSVNPQVKIVKQKDESNKAIRGRECATENTGGSLPLPGKHDKGPICQLPRDGTRRVSSFPAASDKSSGAWCFHPPGNQWLIPVMSLSEGLIYKPYTGPCPPSAAFMAPVHTGCGPLSLPPGSGDLMKPAFGVPVHHQQHTVGVLPGAPAVAPSYFPAPCGVQVVNPLISSSPIEQARSMTGPRPSGQPERHSWSSCNMSNLRREAPFENAQKVHISEENDMQASTASCTGDRSHREKDVLPQFPVSSSVECSGRPPQVHGRDQQARVIKVVPHNPKCATESAARIFRSIQKERQQHDSV
ncbi:hypothetical protein Taro_003909 [Colocasia esculenta]|uniref:Early flowering 3 n=1 Tax=Colocasia esculenta TaxID=4460 RepID=A0A843TL30_COLES|nr:hypothetical protein [Colocasia esculenta]